jgi:hypothetical protein
MRKLLAKGLPGSEKRTLTIIDEGLLIVSEAKTTTWLWESIVSVSSNELFVYLFLADKRYVIFPKRYFASANEVTNFMGLVQSRVIQIKGSANFYFNDTNNTKSKSPYLLGLICIIPLAGAFVGLGLILYGIFKYKDKWLIIIGVAGIAWTVVLYSFVFNIDQNNPTFKNLFAETAQTELNSLFKYVEFYKIQHGAYPDSLEQLNNGDDMAMIYDPIPYTSKKDIKFNYQRVGNHYYLFSSGIDGIPNTKDDIYPQVAKSDSAKFGLIRKSH